MNNKEVIELTLRRLMEDNFLNARHCRKWMETVNDLSVKRYFQNLSSRRSRFAIEIGEEIVFYGGKKPFFPATFSDRMREDNCEEDKLKCIRKALQLHKDSLLKYQEALCRICDGSCREVLLRHKAYLENCIFELKALKSLLKYRTPRDKQFDKMRHEI